MTEKYDSTMEKGIVSFLNDILEMPVIAEKQKSQAPKPSGDFCSYYITVPRKLGYDDFSYKSGDTYEYSGSRVMELFATIYSDSAFKKVSDLRNAFEKQEGKNTLNALGLYVLRAFDVQDVSAILETGYETRASLTVQLCFTETYEEEIGYIETAEVTKL